MSDETQRTTVDVPCIALVFAVDAAPRLIITADPTTQDRILDELPPAMYAVLIETLAMRGIEVEHVRELGRDVAGDEWPGNTE